VIVKKNLLATRVFFCISILKLQRLSRGKSILIVFLGVVILIIYLISVVLKITVQAELDMLKNRGTLVVRLFFIKVFSRDFFLDLDNLQIKFKEKRQKRVGNAKLSRHNSGDKLGVSKKDTPEIHLSIDKKDKQSIASMLFTPIIKGLQIKNADLEINLGIKDDAFLTALAFGSFQIFLNIAVAFLVTKFGTKVITKTHTDFNNNKLQLNATIYNYLSIFSIIKGLFVIALHKINKVFIFTRRLFNANNRHKNKQRKTARESNR